MCYLYWSRVRMCTSLTRPSDWITVFTDDVLFVCSARKSILAVFDLTARHIKGIQWRQSYDLLAEVILMLVTVTKFDCMFEIRSSIHARIMELSCAHGFIKTSLIKAQCGIWLVEFQYARVLCPHSIKMTLHSNACVAFS